MELFSHKYGYKPVKSIIQVESMDFDLRVSLWNAVHIFYLNELSPQRSLKQPENSGMFVFCTLLWRDYFKEPVDRIPESCRETIVYLREYFFDCRWNEVYDFLQFLAKYYPNEDKNGKFKEFCNSMFQRELSGYRFIGYSIAPITSGQEIAEIEEALTSKDSLVPIAIHLQTAIDYLSDRKSPDYRNSIKEAISAVEAICRLIAGSDATLGKALGEITRQGKIEMHESLRQAFDKLYGYTCDEKGIRHSLMELPNLDCEDAKFMLVSCSAFVNYLKVKSSKSGINLECQ